MFMSRSEPPVESIMTLQALINEVTDWLVAIHLAVVKQLISSADALLMVRQIRDHARAMLDPILELELPIENFPF
jgi:hypothetical protein